MINWIASSSVLILIVIAIRSAFKGKIKLRLQYALWAIVLIRLLLPVQFGSSEASVANVVNRSELLEQTAQFITGIERTAAVSSEPVFNEGQVLMSDGQEPVYETDTAFFFPGLIQTIWIIGASIAGLCILISNFCFFTKLRRSRRKLNIRADLPVYECLWLDTPCMFGFFKPCIYINAVLDRRELEHVICHETMHYRQGDHLWSLLRSLCLILHWYNPLVWLAAMLSKRDSELSCDEAVVRRLGEDERIEYGRTLIRMSCSGKTALMSLATSMKGSQSSIRERIKILAAKPGMKLYTATAFALIAVLAVGCTFTGVEEVIAEVPEEPETIAESIEPELPAAANPGLIYDREGNVLDTENHDGLKGSAEAFSTYLNDGMNVHLTIDSRLQQQAEELLDEVLALSGDSSCAALVVVDVKTGEPLAIVSRGADKNLALSGVYSPGDLFLPCTGVAALGTGIIGVSTGIECKGVFDRYMQEGYAPQCWAYSKAQYHGELTIDKALVNNCKYFFYCLGNDLGIDTTEMYARQFGLGEDPGIELAASSGFMANRQMDKPNGQPWTIADTIEASVGGSGSAFTPLQLAEYCAAIANGGNRYSASLVRGIYDFEGKKLYSRQAALTTVDDGDDFHWQIIRKALYQRNNPDDVNTEVFSNGSWKLSGIGNEGAGVSDRLFMGFAPYDDPQIAVAVVVEDTQNTYAANNLALDVVLAYQQQKEGGNA